MSDLKKVLIPLVAALPLSTSLLFGVTSGVAAAQSSCSDVVVIGVPGTNQGPQHFPDKTDNVSMFGEQVSDALSGIRSEFTGMSYSVMTLSYPALGVDNLGAVDAKVIYDASLYKRSKDFGYSVARSAVATTAANCPSSRFLFVGYSQGAHIAGDLAQSILHGNGPVDSSKLAGALLIADPGYNGASPRATEFQYSGPYWGNDEFDSSKHTVFENDDRWEISGSLGKRAAFSDSDPVISICVFGDYICDTGATANAVTKNWMHGVYSNINFKDSEPLTRWAGKAIAELVRG